MALTIRSGRALIIGTVLLLGALHAHAEVVLLGQKEHIAFDEVKADYIAYTVNELLRNCTVATNVDSIPPVTYKGVRVVNLDGKLIEAHIFPNSDSSFMVRVYTRENGVTKLHGKYGNHAYQLISMLEHPARPAQIAPSPICWAKPRLYHPGGKFEDEFKELARKAFRLERVAGTIPKNATVSPNGAYAFHQSETNQSGLSNVRLVVFTEKQKLLKFEANGVFSALDARWLNEKLISFRVWLSRQGGVDVILDVEQDRFVLMDAVADGRLLWEQVKESCKANPNFPECKAECR
jgi:hypothetical protein